MHVTMPLSENSRSKPVRGVCYVGATRRTLLIVKILAERYVQVKSGLWVTVTKAMRVFLLMHMTIDLLNQIRSLLNV